MNRYDGGFWLLDRVLARMSVDEAAQIVRAWLSVVEVWEALDA